MRFTKIIAAGLCAATMVGAGAVSAQDAADRAIKARQSLMQLYAFNLGQLGAMAKGDVAYDSEMASKAALNLVALTSVDQSAMWPEGSDSDSKEASRALPKIWGDFEGIMKEGMAMNAAVQTMGTAAGESLESLQAAMGAVGKSCGSCHEAYRKPNS